MKVKAYSNPLDELVEDMCFAILLYRKAAFYSSHPKIQSTLLELADCRELALAKIQPYASVSEHRLKYRRFNGRERDKKSVQLVSEIKNDPDFILVKQLEGETLCVFHRVHTFTQNSIIRYMVQNLTNYFDKRLDLLLENDFKVA